MSETDGPVPAAPHQGLTVRSATARGLGVAMMAVGVLGLVAAVGEGIHSLLQYGAPLALFGLLGWAAFWRPRVEVSDGGIVVANTWRTLHVPWPALESVDGRYGLRLVTAYGAITAWGAGAPAGRDRVRTARSESAVVVESRWQELRRAGHLDDPRLERPSPEVTWHTRLLVAAGALLAACVVLPLLA